MGLWSCRAWLDISEGEWTAQRSREEIAGEDAQARIRSRQGLLGWGSGRWGEEVMEAEHWGCRGVELASLGPHCVPGQPCDTIVFPPAISLQFSGNPTPSGWRIKGQCVETWPSSSASSPLQCRNTLASCPGRRTPSPSSQVRNNCGDMQTGGLGWERDKAEVLSGLLSSQRS